MTESVGGIQIQVRVTGLAAINATHSNNFFTAENYCDDCLRRLKFVALSRHSVSSIQYVILNSKY